MSQDLIVCLLECLFQCFEVIALWGCGIVQPCFFIHKAWTVRLFSRYISIIKALKYYISFSCFPQSPLQVKYTRCSSTVKTAFPCHPHIRFSHILGMTDWTEYKLLPGYSPYPSTPSMWSSFSSFSKFLVSLQYGMYWSIIAIKSLPWFRTFKWANSCRMTYSKHSIGFFASCKFNHIFRVFVLQVPQRVVMYFVCQESQ